MASHRVGVRRYVPYLRPYRGLTFLMAVASIVAIAAATEIPQVIKSIIDGPVTHAHPQQLIPYALLIAGLAVVEAAGNFGRRSLSGVISFGMENDIRNDFYAHLQGLQVSFHDNWQSGQLLSRAIGDINTVRRFIGFGMMFALVFILQFGAVVVMLFRLNVTLAVITTLVAIPVVFISRHFLTLYAVIARRMQDQNGDVTTVIEEMATGVRIIKAFGRQRRLFDRYVVETEELRAISIASVNTRAGFWSLMTLIPNLNLALVLMLGGLAVLHHQLSIGGLVAFFTYLFMLTWPMDALGWILAMGDEASTASIRLSEVFDSRPDISDRKGARDLGEIHGAIRFENVTFTYPGGRRPVLRGLDLEIRPGETMALVGRTGSGKTSLAMLIPRLYDVTGGRLTIDGHDVRDVTLRSLRGQIGTAFEDPILFSASVHENLVMGRDARSDRELKRAIEIAQAGFVWDLPWGLETRVGEQGYSLSGGQRQRVALARAVFTHPRILVLDDPLSAVDVHTEAQIESALRGVLEGVTAILVAHRPSTLHLADRVALLDEGRIVAVGTHSELMSSQPLYRDLLSQAAGAELKEAQG
jgi:ATP-binding cassette, subfamily B, bacterial